MDVIEAMFIRRLKKGSGKYKGNMSFKCFNCGKVGHFHPNSLTSKRGRLLVMKKTIHSINTIKRLNIKGKDCLQMMLILQKRQTMIHLVTMK